MHFPDVSPLLNRSLAGSSASKGPRHPPLPHPTALLDVMPAFKIVRRWSQTDRWAYLVRLYGDAAFIPEQIATQLWTPAVTNSLLPPADCPACDETADPDQSLCAYHRSRLCDICGGISYCRGGCP